MRCLAPTRWLERHEDSPLAVETAPRHAAWLSGQSSWNHSQLSPGQNAVLDVLAHQRWAPVRIGFPWTVSAARLPYRPEPLAPASLRNSAQFLAARHGTRFSVSTADFVQRLADRTLDELLLLCGSCGGQMLTAAAGRLRLQPQLRVRVIALGPVGRLPDPRPNWTIHALQGRDDRISRWGYRGPVDVLLPGGHMNAGISETAARSIAQLAGGVCR